MLICYTCHWRSKLSTLGYRTYTHYCVTKTSTKPRPLHRVIPCAARALGGRDRAVRRRLLGRVVAPWRLGVPCCSVVLLFLLEEFLLLALVRHAGESFAERVQVFAVVNANEPPVVAWERLELLRETGAQVEVVYFTPHNWYEARPFVNTAHGWSAANLRRFHEEWGGFLQNVELLASVDDEHEGEAHLVADLEKSMAAFARQN